MNTQTFEPELEVLGILAQNGLAYYQEVEDIVRPQCFQDRENRRLFEILQERAQRGVDWSLNFLLQEMGGEKAIKTLTACGDSYIFWEPITVARERVKGLLREAGERWLSANPGAKRRDRERVRAGLEALDYEVKRHDLSMETAGASLEEYFKSALVKTGISTLDHRLGGLRPGELFTLAGQTGHGKSALAGTIAANAIEAGRKVLVCDYEMGIGQTLIRLSSAGAGMDVSKVISSDNEAEQNKLMIRVAEWADKHQGNMTYMEYPALPSIKRELMRGDYDIIIVDYIQALAASIGGGRESVAWNITMSMQRLKEYALAANVCAIVVSQVNQLGEVKESGAIKERADVLLKIKMERDEHGGVSDYEIRIDKNRRGAHGTVDVKLDPYKMRVIGKEFGV